MARKLNLVTPDLGAPDADFVDGFYLDEDAGVPGTPILADEKTSIYYFFSRLMDAAGLSFNGNVDSFTSSQFFDAFLVASQKPETETITTSSTLTLNSANKIFTGDTSGGDLALVVPSPDFIGQAVEVLCDGTGIIEVDFPGKLPSRDVPVSNTFSLKLHSPDGVIWVAVMECVSDFIDGSARLLYTPKKMKIQDQAGSTAVTLGSSGWYLWDASRTFPVAFSSVIAPSSDFDIKLTPGSSVNVRPVIFSYHNTTAWTSSQIRFRGYSNGNGDNVFVNIAVEGDY